MVVAVTWRTAAAPGAVPAPSPPQHCTAWAGYITYAGILFALRKSWEQGLAGSHLQANSWEGVPKHLWPGLSPCHPCWQGDKEEPPHLFWEKAHRVHTALSARGQAISRCSIPPPLAPGLSTCFGLLSPGFWPKDSPREGGISRQSSAPTEWQPSPHSGTPKGSLCPLLWVSASPQADRKSGHKASRLMDPARAAQL